MQQPEPSSEPQRGLAFRKGRPLYIDTKVLEEQRAQYSRTLPSLTHNAPVETILYQHSPEKESEPPPDTAARRQSRMSRIFGRSKTPRTARHDLQLPITTEENEPPLPQQRRSADGRMPYNSPPAPPVPSIPNGNGSESSGTPPKLKPKKERLPRPVMTWDPPPLFQAYPQAVKSGIVSAPSSADSVLRMDKARKNSGSSDVGSVASESQDYVSDDDLSREGRKKKGRRGISTFGNVECTPKTYVLATSGFMLQYSGEGSHDRLPEKIMQLNKDSAAFASDAIPGKHWVLQITQTSTEEGNVPDSQKSSVFSKLSFWSDSRKAVSNFLLVMTSPEEMDSWLVTVRREIQALGGKTYRPDETVKRNPSLVARQLRERPSRQFLVQNSSEKATSPSSPRNLAHRASMFAIRSSSAAGSPPPHVLHSRPSMGFQTSANGNISPYRSSMIVMSPSKIYNSTPWSSDSVAEEGQMPSFNVDKELPKRPSVTSQVTVDALGIISSQDSQAKTEFRPVIPSRVDSLPRSDTASISRQKQSPMVPISAFNAEVKKATDSNSTSEGSPGKASFDTSGTRSPAAPNFSVPKFSKRYSQARSDSIGTRATSSGSGTTTRGRSPSLTDGESTLHDSVNGEPAVHARFSPPRSALRLATLQSTVDSELVTAIPRTPPNGVSLGIGFSRAEKHSSTDTSASEQLIKHALASSQQMASPPPPSRPPPAAPIEAPPIATLAPPPPSQNSSLTVSTDLEIRPSSAQGMSSDSKKLATAESLPTLRRPQSMQIRKASKAQSQNKQDFVTSNVPLPTAAQPLTIQERRHIIGSSPLLHGPPAAPPPSLPLPKLPPGAGPAKPTATTTTTTTTAPSLPPLPLPPFTYKPSTTTTTKNIAAMPMIPAPPPTPPPFRDTPPSQPLPQFPPTSHPYPHHGQANHQLHLLSHSPPNDHDNDMGGHSTTRMTTTVKLLPELHTLSYPDGYGHGADVVGRASSATPPVPLSPGLSETWNVYLQRIGAS